MEHHNLEQLIRQLQESGALVSSRVKKAMTEVDRIDFLPEEEKDKAYYDIPLPIGYDQTISQPAVVAFMLELLDICPGEKILDVGSGSGWTTALMSVLTGPGGNVIGIERIPELVSFGKNNLKKYGFSQAKIHFSGNEFGMPREAPFDKILVSAAAEEMPLALLDQIKNGGLMVLPIRQTLVRAEKNQKGKVKLERWEGFSFVPLIVEE